MPRHSLPTALLALAALASAARGESLVLESYPGQRPADASRLLGPLLDELTNAGFRAQTSGAGRRIEDRVSRSGGTLSAEELTEVTALVEDGYSAFLKGDFAPAVEKLARAVDRFHDSPAAIAQDGARRELVAMGLIGLTMAHKRLGHSEEAERAMAELLRSFPDREFNRTKYGPEAHEFYQRIRTELGEKGRGALTVTCDDENVVIFLDERFESVGGMHKNDLLPGVYRVYVQKGTTAGRVHLVTIEPRGDVRLQIEWKLEAALHTGKDWVGLAFANSGEKRALESRLGTKVALAAGATSLVVVGIDQREGRRAMTGTVYSIDTGNAQRSAFLVLEPTEPTGEQIRGLARFLAGGPAQPFFAVENGGDPTPAEHDAPRAPGGPYRVWKWVALGGAVVATAAGVTLLVLDGSCKDSIPGSACPTVYDTLLPGVATTAIGVALGGLTTYLFLKDKAGAPRTISAAPLPGGVFVTANWGFDL